MCLRVKFHSPRNQIAYRDENHNQNIEIVRVKEIVDGLQSKAVHHEELKKKKEIKILAVVGHQSPGKPHPKRHT